MKNAIILKGLKADHFMHPGDKVAIEKLKGMPQFRKFMERLLVEGLEDDVYLLSLADNVKLGPKQGKKLHDMLTQASKILDMETPLLFMDTDPVPNAYAFGERKPMVILTSGLIDTFSDDEIFTVIGHELGHIKCRHTLYTMMAENVYLLMQIFSLFLIFGQVIAITVGLSLMAWYRRSELSADRAALLATQSQELVARTMMKLAGGGSNKIYESLSLEPFLEQADEYEKLQAEMLKAGGYKKYAYVFGTLMQTAFSTHPWPALRTKEAIKFYKGPRYNEIISKKYPQTEERAEGIFASEGIATDLDFEAIKQDLKEVGKEAKNKTAEYSKGVTSYLRKKIKKVAEEVNKEINEGRNK